MDKNLLAWRVEIHSLSCIVFATTKPKAQWIATKCYWETYGRTKGSWPGAIATRVPRYDKSLYKEREPRAYIEDYVADTC